MRKLLIEKTYTGEDGQKPNIEDVAQGNAGTDYPWYRKGNFEIMASYDSDDAYPFAYFPVDPATGELKFFIGGDYEYGPQTHSDIFADALYEYIYNLVVETFEPVEETFCDKMRELGDYIENNNMKVVDRNYGFSRVKVIEDENGGNRIIFKEKLAEIFGELGINLEVNDSLTNYIYFTFENAYWDLSDFCDEFINEITTENDFRDGFDQNHVCNIFNISSNELFNKSRLEGRIWMEKELITFYPGQQPSREEMRLIIKNIAEWYGMPENTFYDFHTIFEVGSKEKYTGSGYKTHNDAEVQCCTIADYIAGKYNGFNREEELDMVKNRKGVDQLMVHLAGQKEKQNFFKDFRNTRDRVVYSPREKAAGTLAGYHAMRYPFGENTIKEDKQVPSFMVSQIKRMAKDNPERASSLLALLKSRPTPETSSDSSAYDSGTYGSSYYGSGTGEGGTDFPHYADPDTGRVYDACWWDEMAHPFGFWNNGINGSGEEVFSIGDETKTHANACGKVAKIAISNAIREWAENDSSEIAGGINDLLDEFADNGYKFNPNTDEYYSLDENGDAIEVFELSDYIDVVEGRMYSNDDVTEETMWYYFRMALKTMQPVDSDRIYDEIVNRRESRLSDYNPENKDEVDEMFDDMGIMEDFDSFFGDGRLEGRIWEGEELMSFYDGQEPTPQELSVIVRNLGQSPEIGAEYDEILDYMVLYHDEKNHLRGCKIRNYISGGADTDHINPEERQGAVFIPHLAAPEEKFNYFKDFRNTRDKAVYAPREKAAGSLAAYHAMRYPFGENTIKESLTGSDFGFDDYEIPRNEAGTDEPSYYDEETGEVIDAYFEDDDADAFGYFPSCIGGPLKFYTTLGMDYDKCHLDIIDSINYELVTNFVREKLNPHDKELYEFFNEIKEIIIENHLEYDRYDFVQPNGDNPLNFETRLSEFFEKSGIGIEVDTSLSEYFCDMLNNYKLNIDRMFSGHGFADNLIEFILSYGNGMDDFLETFGLDERYVQYAGRLLGRIWTGKKLITFYPGQQPSRAEMDYVIHDISKEFGISYDELLTYRTIFETESKEKYTGTGYRTHGDATIQCCTIADYIAGKYNGFNRDVEVEMVRNRTGVKDLVPHLANQKDKFNFFKNFRATRDKAVYAPREKAAGSLAAYHAMRYPYGESKEPGKKVYIKESALKRLRNIIENKEAK